MTEQINEYLSWKGSYALPAMDRYKYPLNKVQKLDSLDDVFAYKKSIEKECSPATVAYSLTIVRDFIKYRFYEKNDKRINPYMIKIPRFITRRRIVANDDDVKKLVADFDENKFTELRNKLLILLMFETGARVSEIANLNISDLEKNTAIIRTKKTVNERVIMWSEKTHKLFIRYLGVRICLNSQDPVFITLQKGKGRITTRSIERIVESSCKKVGLQKNLTPHSFRHGKAHKMLDNGANVKEIQVTLGHSEDNPRASFQYIRLDITQQKNILKKYV